MFEKIDVNAEGAHPLFRWLQQRRRGLLWTQRIKWNFTKFLVNRAGEVTARYSPTTKPQRLSRTIETLLKKPAI
jgi:glutathione peroxidase